MSKPDPLDAPPQRKKSARRPMEDTGRCGHQWRGERCKFPAVWFEQGAKSRGWCFYHSHVDNRGNTPEQDSFYTHNQADAECLRDTLSSHYGASAAVLVGRLAGRMPELERGQDEPRSAYQARMRKLGRGALRGKVRSMWDEVLSEAKARGEIR